MEKSIILTREIDAPVERVWQAWTDPNQLRQWWAPRGFNTPEAKLDVRKGGTFRIVMLAGEDLGQMSRMRAPMSGEFLEVVPNERLVCTTNALDETGNVLLSGETSVTFDGRAGKTSLTVHANAEGSGPMTEAMLGGMEQGWNEQLDKLGEFLAQ